MSRSNAAHPPAGRHNTHFGRNDVGWQALGPAVGCLAFSTVVVVARWIARRRLAQCEGLDDYVIILSLFLSWTMTALLAAQVNGGAGVYAGPLTLPTIAQLCIASNALWAVIVALTKASILIQYLRIFSTRRLRLASYAFLAALLPSACWAIFGGIFLCTPTSKLWHPQTPGHCLSKEKYWLSVAGTDIGLDFLILLLPLPSISALHLPRKQKCALLLVFTLGFVVCVVSLARMLTVLLLAHRGNFTASAIWAIVWSAVEANVGISCASLLSLKPLVARYFPAVLVETDLPKHCMRIAWIRDDETTPRQPQPSLHPPRAFWRNNPSSSTDEKPFFSPSSTTKMSGTVTPPCSSRSASTVATLPPRSSRWGSLSQQQQQQQGRPLAFGSPQPLAEMQGIRVVEPERCALMLRRPGTLSLFDMLQEGYDHDDGDDGDDDDDDDDARDSSGKVSDCVGEV